MRHPVNPLPQYVKLDVFNMPDTMSLSEASKYMFGGRGKGTLHADCQFLGIDTKKTSDHWGSLTRHDVFILHVFLHWRITNRMCNRSRYWIDCTIESDLPKGVKPSAETANTEVRLSYMRENGGSEERFNAEFDEFLALRKARIKDAVPMAA